MGRKVSPVDLAAYKTISRPRISPNGDVAVSVHAADLKEDRYTSDIWVLRHRGKLERFTSSGKDGDPTWSPNGRMILFSSKRGIQKDEKGGELYVIPAAGGEAKLAVKRKEGVLAYAWAPDSKSVYFVSPVVDADTPDEKESDVKVIRRPGVWSNGEGFVYNQVKHIFRVDLNGGEPRQMTRGDAGVAAFSVSHDGRRIAYTSAPDELKPYLTQLFVRDVASGKTKKLTKGMGVLSICWSPDDRSIAFIGTDLPRGFASHGRLWVVGADGASRARLVDRSDRNKFNTLNSDVRSKAYGPGTVVWEDDWVYHYQQDAGSAHVYRTNVRGVSELVLGGDRSVEGMDVRKGVVVFVAMDSSNGEELYFMRDGSEVRLTSLNSGLRSKLGAATPTQFSFRASDGVRLDGWVLLPADEGRKGRSRPAVLYVHGGPKTTFGNAYMHELQCFAAAGYVVVFMNPRGSDGYSEKFADIRGRYGTRDFQDLLEGLDFASKSFPIDPRRVAIAGGSYGGFMTNWAIGHTDRFRAAVTDRSVASWSSFYGTSDIGPYFTEDQAKGNPWDDEEKLMAASPIRYAKKMNAPLLIVHSMEDYRCPWGDGLQLFTALKTMKKEVELVVFPGENHDLSRVGKPKHRVERLDHYIRWFDSHLKPTR